MNPARLKAPAEIIYYSSITSLAYPLEPSYPENSWIPRLSYPPGSASGLCFRDNQASVFISCTDTDVLFINHLPFRT